MAIAAMAAVAKKVFMTIELIFNIDNKPITTN